MFFTWAVKDIPPEGYIYIWPISCTSTLHQLQSLFWAYKFVHSYRFTYSDSNSILLPIALDVDPLCDFSIKLKDSGGYGNKKYKRNDLVSAWISEKNSELYDAVAGLPKEKWYDH